MVFEYPRRGEEEARIRERHGRYHDSARASNSPGFLNVQSAKSAISSEYWGAATMSRLLVLSFVALFISAGCQRAGPPLAGPEGAWRLSEVHLTGPDGESVDRQPLPALYTFTREHYSIVRMLGEELPPDNARLWYPTEAEKARQHDAIIVNAGTYELSDSILTTHPFAAKTPEFIGGRTVYEWRVVTDSLWLTTLDIRSRDDVQDPFVADYRLVVKLVRAE